MPSTTQKPGVIVVHDPTAGGSEHRWTLGAPASVRDSVSNTNVESSRGRHLTLASSLYMYNRHVYSCPRTCTSPREK